MLKCSKSLLVLMTLFINPANADSLFDKHKYKEITADQRAFRIGDTVTILVIETATARASAGSADNSGYKLSADASVDNKGWNYGLGVGSETKGNASTQRQGQFRAQITAVVTSIDENGNLVVSGKQSLTIDGEQQIIELTGQARRSDITSQNTILSSRLFDADIKFVGAGSVSKGKEEGVFSKIFKWLGLK